MHLWRGDEKGVRGSGKERLYYGIPACGAARLSCLPA